jgi:hypothetical protein
MAANWRLPPIEKTNSRLFVTGTFQLPMMLWTYRINAADTSLPLQTSSCDKLAFAAD